jgi:hypothetical protein
VVSMKGDARRYADILPRYTGLRQMLLSISKQAIWELCAEKDLCRCEPNEIGINRYTCIHHQIIAWNANYEDDEHDKRGDVK